MHMTRPSESNTSINGPAWAAILACGIGCFALGLMIVLGERTGFFSTRLNFYNPVGNLSGKTIVAIAIWLIAWEVLHFRWKNLHLIETGRIMTLTFVLVVLGVLASCPLVFDMFSGH
jgi:peptidoglycan biosynthesis protein MviN/MurJ (putative lipid II flippase)